MPTRLQLGAPGIYSPPPDPLRALTGARMDVCAFVGVAPRGPARRPAFTGVPWAERPCDGDAAAFPRSVAVAVHGFDEYRRLYGGFEGPGLLPYAVASFFENGGLRAHVVRVVPAYDGGPDAGAALTAEGFFTRVQTSDELANDRPSIDLADRSGTIRIGLRARSEGSWGNAISARLAFTTRPLSCDPHGARALRIPSDLALPVGALLRVTPLLGAPVLRSVTAVRDEWAPGSGSPARRRLAELDAALPPGAQLGPGARVEIVEATLELSDGAAVERHGALGLDPDHPRWLARVVHQESSLAEPRADWIAAPLRVEDPALPPYRIAAFEGGRDDYAAIVPEDFFDAGWVPGDECAGAGIHALVGLPDLAAVCVPDLYSPGPIVEPDDVTPPAPRCGPTFERSSAAPRTPPRAPPPVDLGGLRLDPALDLDAIASLQRRVVELAEQQGFVALLDVPPGLGQRQILRWRGAFSSAYAAAYHPWLRVARADDARDALLRVPPSAVAAGIIAQRELAFGIPHGAANVVAAGVVDVDDRVSPARHDELHPAAINVFLRERDGVRLSAARTLGRDPAYRQLSVRRLVLMLRRTLDQQMQWAAFEPNGPALRRDLRHMLVAYLRELWRANAFSGATEEEAFFVRCDDDLNPRRVSDAGRLVCEIGIAPAEPLEFIVLRIERGGDGTLRVEG